MLDQPDCAGRRVAEPSGSRPGGGAPFVMIVAGIDDARNFGRSQVDIIRAPNSVTFNAPGSAALGAMTPEKPSLWSLGALALALFVVLGDERRGVEAGSFCLLKSRVVGDNRFLDEDRPHGNANHRDLVLYA